MKKTVLTALILTGLFLASSPGIVFCSNLAGNGGFEIKAEDNLPEGWQVDIARQTKAEITLDENEKHSGNYSLKISVAPPGGRVFISLKEDAAGYITPDNTYKASFWIKSKDLDYNRFSQAPAFRLNFRPQRSRPGSVADLIAEIKGNTDWTKVTLNSPPAPQNSNRIHVDMIITKGTVWIDDIRIREAD